MALHPNQIKAIGTRAAAVRRQRFDAPALRYLFFELTEACNEHCIHCASRCDGPSSCEVPSDVLLRVLEDVKRRLGSQQTMLCVTGGEPLLRRDFFELMSSANNLGYRWGMTTNGTLITHDVAARLADCGMRTVSVSVDGLEETHDWFRGGIGSYRKAMAGVANLLEVDAFEHIQVTTVIHKRNIDQLESLFDQFDDYPIDSWRLVAIEPMGRALDHPELMLDLEDHVKLLEFIKSKRSSGWPLSYGCCHYLGNDFELQVRDAPFQCGAGTHVASIMANGDIGTCLDIERDANMIQGNVYSDDFVSVWLNRFQFFRRDLAELDPTCANCEERGWCAGGSWHSFDFKEGTQRVCFKNALF